jgi:hypothetical protein
MSGDLVYQTYRRIPPENDIDDVQSTFEQTTKDVTNESANPSPELGIGKKSSQKITFDAEYVLAPETMKIQIVLPLGTYVTRGASTGRRYCFVGNGATQTVDYLDGVEFLQRRRSMGCCGSEVKQVPIFERR